MALACSGNAFSSPSIKPEKVPPNSFKPKAPIAKGNKIFKRGPTRGPTNGISEARLPIVEMPPPITEPIDIIPLDIKENPNLIGVIIAVNAFFITLGIKDITLIMLPITGIC